MKLIRKVVITNELGLHARAAAKIAKEAFSTGKTVRQVALEHQVLSEKELNRVLDPFTLTEPSKSKK